MSQEHSLWRFSLEVYAHPELQSLLLEAQDTAGADVNFILAALWLARHGVALAPERAQALWQATAELREQGLAPVRALRRTWKHIAALQPARQTLQALELTLEKQVQDRLYQALAPATVEGQASEEPAAIDVAALTAGNLVVLVVSDPSAWHLLVPKIEAQYLAIAGQI